LGPLEGERGQEGRSVDPGPHPVHAGEGAEDAEEFQQDLLHGILRILVVPEDSEAEGISRLPERCQEPEEGLLGGLILPVSKKLRVDHHLYKTCRPITLFH
jgi:hypothetical protein